MIIDMLAHIGVKKGEDYHVESLIEIMNQSGVDKCMICSQLETVNNEYIYESVQKFPERTFGFAVVNPWDINGEEQLEKCFRDYHFYGLKMNAIRFGYSADRHSLLSPYLNCAGHMENVLWSTDSRICSPYRISGHRWPGVFRMYRWYYIIWGFR